MCKIRKKFQLAISKEKSVKIRERVESKFERLATILLGFLLAGNWFAHVKGFYDFLGMIIIVLAILFLYILIELWLIPQYSKYTNELIRKESK